MGIIVLSVINLDVSYLISWWHRKSNFLWLLVIHNDLKTIVSAFASRSIIFPPPPLYIHGEFNYKWLVIHVLGNHTRGYLISWSMYLFIYLCIFLSIYLSTYFLKSFHLSLYLAITFYSYRYVFMYVCIFVYVCACVYVHIDRQVSMRVCMHIL